MYLPEEGRRALQVECASQVSADVTLSAPALDGDLTGLSHHFRPRFLFGLGEPVVDTASGRMFASYGGRPIMIEESSTWPIQNLIRTGEHLPTRTNRLPYLDEEVLVFPSIHNYFHWLFEGLANFLIARERAPKACVILTVGEVPRFVSQSLELLDLDVRRASRFAKVRTARLFDRGRDIGSAHPDEVAALRRMAERVPHTTGASTIYVSRKNSSRSLPGEDVVEALMESMAITVLRAEELSFPEQIAAFTSARTIIAPHGAGLANIAFCRPGTKVRELMPLSRVNRCYQWLSSVAKLDYQMFTYDDRSLKSSADAVSRALGSSGDHWS